jgi:hypothetical protein
MIINCYQKGLQSRDITKFKFSTSVYVEIMVLYVATHYNVTTHASVCKGTWCVCLHNTIVVVSLALQPSAGYDLLFHEVS